MTRPIVTLAGLLIVLVGFIGGVVVEKHWGTVNGQGATASSPSGGPFGNGGTGGPQAGGAASGTVKMVDGTTVYVTTASGEVVIVKTTNTTTVNAETAGAVKDLKVGDSVTITGTTATDGSMTATQIVQNP